MYEQFLFYWLLWILFILVYFFMDKGKKRSFFISLILILIICSNVSLKYSDLVISLSFLLILAVSIFFYVSNPLTLYKTIVAFILMLGYVSLLIWEKITPIWFFMPSFFIIPVLSVLITIILVREFYEQIAVALVGITFGQLIYELILISYNLHNVIGETIFFIHTCFVILFLVTIHAIQASIIKFSELFQNKWI